MRTSPSGDVLEDASLKEIQKPEVQLVKHHLRTSEVGRPRSCQAPQHECALMSRGVSHRHNTACVTFAFSCEGFRDKKSVGKDIACVLRAGDCWSSPLEGCGSLDLIWYLVHKHNNDPKKANSTWAMPSTAMSTFISRIVTSASAGYNRGRTRSDPLANLDLHFQKTWAWPELPFLEALHIVE